MNSLAELTKLIQRARQGDAQALNQICDRMQPRIAGLARQRLGTPAPLASASDIAVSVLGSFCNHFARGGFPDLQDSKSLWRLLARLTCNKIADAYRRENAAIRGGAFTRVPDGEEESRVLSELASAEPDPAVVVEMQDLLCRLLALLPSQLQNAVLWRMQEGCSNREIAAKMGVSLWTVEEMFRTIRTTWEQMSEPEASGLAPSGGEGA